MENRAINTAYVTADGTYGVGNIIIFNDNMLTEEQWDVVDNIGDNDRYDYITAVLNGNAKAIAYYEQGTVEENTYLISRIEDWSDEQWEEVVSAVEDTVVAVADSFGRENKEEN